MGFDNTQNTFCDLERLVVDAVARALKDENPENLLKWLQKKLPHYSEPGFWEKTPPGMLNAMAAQFQHMIWNSLPLPSNNFQPRPLPLPKRNDPCLCGSGLKYKHCCGTCPKMAPIDPLLLWPFVLKQLSKKKLKEALAGNLLPVEGVIAAAIDHVENGCYEKVVDLLAPLFDGSLKKPRPGLEGALEMLCNVYDKLGEGEEKLELLGRITGEAPTSLLRAEAWQRLCVIHIDLGETQIARQAFEKAMHDSPDDPFLSVLEIQLLDKEERWELARERARFWLKRLQRSQYDPERMKEIVDFLEEVTDDPERGLANLRRKADALDPESERLLAWAEEALRRPLPVYCAVAETVGDEKDEKARLKDHFRSMGMPSKEISRALKMIEEQKEQFADDKKNGEGDEAGGSDDSLILGPPRGLATLEEKWHRVCGLEKPFGTADCPMGGWEGWEPEAARRWLAFLEKNPKAADSLDIIDDLATASLLRPAGLTASLIFGVFLPLLHRVRAIVEKALSGIEAPLLKWNRPCNRPALRSLIRLYYVLQESPEDEDESEQLLMQLLDLNPDDNHGLRAEAMNDLLCAGRNEEAVRLGQRYGDDLLPETRYGMVLAYYRLKNLRRAQEVAEEAIRGMPLVARYLVRERVRRPKLSSLGIRPGGEDQAWFYREKMREEWKRSTGALLWLKKVMKIVGVGR